MFVTHFPVKMVILEYVLLVQNKSFCSRVKIIDLLEELSWLLFIVYTTFLGSVLEDVAEFMLKFWCTQFYEKHDIQESDLAKC